MFENQNNLKNEDLIVQENVVINSDIQEDFHDQDKDFEVSKKYTFTFKHRSIL